MCCFGKGENVILWGKHVPLNTKGKSASHWMEKSSVITRMEEEGEETQGTVLLLQGPRWQHFSRTATIDIGANRLPIQNQHRFTSGVSRPVIIREGCFPGLPVNQWVRPPCWWRRTLYSKGSRSLGPQRWIAKPNMPEVAGLWGHTLEEF